MGGLRTVILYTPDVGRQRTFYEKSLGLEPAGASAERVRYGTRGAALELAARAGGAIELAFEVADLDAWVAELAARGVTPDPGAAPGEVAVRDPEGNRVQFTAAGAPSPAGRWPHLSHAIINAAQFAACVHFYHDVLGLRLAAEREHWAEFDTGETRLAVHAQRDEDGLPLHADQRLAFALHDDDFETWAAELRERGVPFATTPTEAQIGMLAEVEDADGWFVVLRGPAPEAPLEESLAEDYDDEDTPRSTQIRRTADGDAASRPGFGSRKQVKKRIEKVATRGFESLTRQRSTERGGAPAGPRYGGARPGGPPSGPRP
ncbi:MAG TPA: VOC family protein, partial [Candidatus Eisenbacteria bacterium]|nr:VOC family protein [Candidatus Eisenbacteria bacterium]